MLRNIGVIGSGLMGAGIAQVAAQAGLHVLMTDQMDEALQSALGRIRNGLKRLQDRGGLEEDPNAIMERIETTSQMSEFAGLDVVIEAISEAGGDLVHIVEKKQE